MNTYGCQVRKSKMQCDLKKKKKKGEKWTSV